MLNESNTPEKIHYQNKELKWADKDARAIGLIGDYCFISDYKGRHADFLSDNSKKISESIKGKDLYYKGRIWDDKKIITFWDYPESNEKLIKLLDLLKKEDKSINIQFVSLPNNEFVSVDKYENNDIKQDTDIDHLDTTKSKEVPIGVGSRKNKPIELKYKIYQE